MKHFHFEEIDSTNSWIKRNLALIPDEGMLWVTAKLQTSGRGSHGRTWVSPKEEGLYLSFGYWSQEESEVPLSMIFAEKLTAFFARYGLATSVKPPNDLLVSGKKLCGILCETAWLGEKRAHIIGIGINVKSSPQGLDQPTTSLWEEGVKVTIQELFQEIQQFLAF